jgi:hypothetical protein
VLLFDRWSYVCTVVLSTVVRDVVFNDDDDNNNNSNNTDITYSQKLALMK